jgi:hypothetical protein
VAGSPGRDDKGEGGASTGNWLVAERTVRSILWYPTQAKERLDPDFPPRCAREVPVCAFHKERRMQCIYATSLHRKSGPWGTQPWLSLKQAGLPSQFAYPCRLLDDFTRTSIKSQPLRMTILWEMRGLSGGARSITGSRSCHALSGICLQLRWNVTAYRLRPSQGGGTDHQ